MEGDIFIHCFHPTFVKDFPIGVTFLTCLRLHMHQSTQRVPAGISAYNDKEALKQKTTDSDVTKVRHLHIAKLAQQLLK